MRTHLLQICTLALAGQVLTAFGQIQVAGTLHVDVDATGQPVGTLAYLTNNGAAGGVFLANSNGVVGASPQITALGGNGTRGVLLDGNQISLRHFTDTSGATVMLPPPGLVGVNPDFSVEVWMYKATINDETGPVCWGNRNVAGQNVSCNWGRNTGWGGFSWQGTGYDHGWASVPTAGAWHHLVWTYDAIAVTGGAGTVRLYRDGVLDKAETQTSTPSISGTNNILLGLQHSGAGYFGFAAGVLGKARIHDGVLTQAQIVNNYNYEVANFTNGTPAALLTTAPLHRYSFNLPATNNAIGMTVPDTGSAPAAAAIIRGTTLAAAAIPYFDGNQLILPNYGARTNAATNGYVDLPNGMLSSLSSSNGGPGAISFELWVQPTANKTWSELLYFGNSTVGEITTNGGIFDGQNGIVVPAQVNTSVEQGGVRGAPGDRTIGCYLLGSRKHIVVTWDELNNLIKIYHEGVQVGQFTANVKMNAIIDVNNWLGRSGWGGDAVASANYREFRIYNRLLSPAEIRLDYLVGPYEVNDGSTMTWNGNVNGNWDASTYNWLANAVATNFTNGKAVRLDDTATGTTTINLAATVAPQSITANNSTKSYTIGGAGNLSGTGSLTKNGNNTLTLTGAQTNDYTGPTIMVGGKLIVSKLANGGLPSAIGASSANGTNLVLGGGTLSYQGPSTTIDRGYLVSDAIGTLEVQNSLTLSGFASATSPGGFAKAGPGTLTYSTIGSNLLSAGAFPGYQVTQGTVVFDGTAGGQTNRNMSEFWVGSSPSTGANLILTNVTMFLDSWLSVGRGNGSVGNTSTLALNNAIVNIAGTANGFGMGYNGLLAGYRATQVTTLNGTSAMNCVGNANLGESTGSFGTLRINNNSWFRCVTPRLGINLGATGAVYLANSGAYTNTGYMSIGTGAGTNDVGSGGVGLFVAKDNAVVSSTGDFNVTDLANSVGELDISNNATFYVNGAMYIGKAAGTVATVNQAGGSFLKVGGGDCLIGGNATAAASSVGTWNLYGGVLSIPGNFQPGAYGQGTFNQTGGTAFMGGWTSIGRYAGSSGFVTISGGTLYSTNPATDVIVGEGGTGTLTLSGTGVLNITNNLRIGNLAGGAGTVNLNAGGTIVTKRVFMGNAGASSYFFFNGGLLQAAAGASADFMSGLSSVFVASGALIDSGANDITIGQDLYDGGMSGGLTKLGSGSLTLSGALYYPGPTLVSAGKLGITTHDASLGSMTVADGAGLSLQVLDYAGAAITPSSLTLGSSLGAALDINLGSFGSPPTAPMNVSAGMVTAKGTITVSVTPDSTILTTGEIPLLSYGTLTGGGSFVLGTLPPGVFGYLTNDTAATPKFIGVVVTSVFLPRWEGLAGGTWDIQVTTNWIDQVTFQPEFFYQGSRAVFDDQALGTTNVNLVTTVSPGGVVVSNNLLTYAISGVGRITGGGGFTKLGTGSVTLSTTNNTYTGKTLIDEGGTLISTVPNNLGTNSALVISNASTLSLGTNNQRFNSATLANGTIAASGATITATTYSLDNGSVNALLAGGTLATFGLGTDLVTLGGGNTYTGRTYLAGSTLAVTNLANGGLPSGLGASSAGATNLVFAGGALSYTGPAVTTDRGYSVAGGGRLSVSGNLKLVGPVAASSGNFAKAGPAALTYARLDTNLVSTAGYYIAQGTVIFDGGASTPTNYFQTNRVVGDVWVGYDQTNAGALVLTNSSLGITAWLALDRGNGTVGSASKVTLYDSVVTAGNMSMGYANGIAGNSSFPVLSLLGNSSFTSANRCFIGENVGGVGTITVAGTSRLTLTAEWFALGNAGTGTMVLSNQARVSLPGDYNLGDIQYGNGTLNMYDNATNLALTLYVGKGPDSFGVVNQYGGYLGKVATGGGDWRIANNATATGGYNLLGGVFEPQNNFQIGAYGAGTWNQSGGVANCASWPVVGRFVGGLGTMTVSGGIFNQTGSGNFLIIGEETTGTLTINNTGFVNCVGGLSIGHTATGIGTVNLDGGTLATRLIQSPGAASTGSGVLNLNGGVLQANANNETFMTGITAANVLAGGAIMDSSTNSITIAQPLLDGGGNGGLTKLGAGTLTLSGVSTYTGSTVVSNGTLLVNGVIPGNASVRSGATLGGTGTIAGVVTVNAGGTLAAGPNLGTLTLNSTPVLQGVVRTEVWHGRILQADKLVVAGNPIAYSGTLIITNIGQPLVANDTFTLFSASAYSGSFTLVSQTPNQAVTWDTSRLAVDGTIKVAAVVSTVPPQLTNTVSGGNLVLSWPADHLGWRLEVQTNSLAVGISNNWSTWPNSTTVTSVTVPLNPANPAVFFRLVYP